MNTKFHPAKTVQHALREVQGTPLVAHHWAVIGLNINGDGKDVTIGTGKDISSAFTNANANLAKDYPGRSF